MRHTSIPDIYSRTTIPLRLLEYYYGRYALLTAASSCPSLQQLFNDMQHVHLEQEEGARDMRHRGSHAALHQRDYQGNQAKKLCLP